MGKDFWAGLAISIASLATGIYCYSNYEMGTIRNAGPGLFPVAVCVVLTVLGIVLLITGIRQAREPIVVEWRPLFFITLAMAVFPLTIQSIGLIGSITATTFTASMAARDFRPVASVIQGVLIAGASYLIFVIGLRLPVPAFLLPW